MHIFVLIIFSLSLLSCVSTGETQRLDGYDRFSNRESQSLVVNISSSMSMLVRAERERVAKQGCGYEDVTIGFSYSSANSGNDWRYLKVREIDIIADEKRLNSISVVHDGEVQTAASGYPYTQELLALNVSSNLAKTIVNSSSLEFKIGFDEFILSPNQISDLNAYAKQICI